MPFDLRPRCIFCWQKKKIDSSIPRKVRIGVGLFVDVIVSHTIASLLI